MEHPIESVDIYSAHVGLDLCTKRGQVCRGAYIVSNKGEFYLTHSGKWTWGVEGDENWWEDTTQAESFLYNMQRQKNYPDYKKLYHELIMNVGKKFSGESRHETALRYIKNFENNPHEPKQPTKFEVDWQKTFEQCEKD